jgi:hypothetical protein
VSISGLGSFGPTGSTEVEPEATTTYTLTAFYHDGTTKQESVAVTVEQAPLLLYGLLALLAVAAAIIVILLIRRYRHGSEPPGPLPREPITVSAEIIAPAETAPATTSVISAVAARLTLPDGSEIVLAGNNRDFGRHDFEKFLPQEKLTCISRQHFNITYEDNQYFIEDRASTNGTRVNGIEIRGAGRRALEDNDDLEIATRLHVKFSKNVSKEVNQ